MTDEKTASFAALLRRCTEAGTLLNVTFHSPMDGDGLKVRGEPRVIGASP